eukprot:m.68015 g.68015  ORF g.68015 m.68015 type:complete len:545 (+) comp12185_c1_seq1:461-2095(+)
MPAQVQDTQQAPQVQDVQQEMQSAQGQDVPKPAPREENCSICLCEFESEQAVLLNCGHYFHSACCQEWYKTKQPCTCPLCRAKFEIRAHFDGERKLLDQEPDEWKAVQQEVRQRRPTSGTVLADFLQLIFHTIRAPGVEFELASPLLSSPGLERAMRAHVRRQHRLAVNRRHEAAQRRRRARAQAENPPPPQEDHQEQQQQQQQLPPHVNTHGGHAPATSGKKTRANLPKSTTNMLKTWLFDHHQHPYPTDAEKREMAANYGLTVLQINNWFINARRRLLNPLKEKAEAGAKKAHTADSSDAVVHAARRRCVADMTAAASKEGQNVVFLAPVTTQGGQSPIQIPGHGAVQYVVLTPSAQGHTSGLWAPNTQVLYTSAVPTTQPPSDLRTQEETAGAQVQTGLAQLQAVDDDSQAAVSRERGGNSQAQHPQRQEQQEHSNPHSLAHSHSHSHQHQHTHQHQHLPSQHQHIQDQVTLSEDQSQRQLTDTPPGIISQPSPSHEQDHMLQHGVTHATHKDHSQQPQQPHTDSSAHLIALPEPGHHQSH